ncbi:MAG: hypothetical protein ACRENI_02920 [Gemmatimonadaceae bacterium]
MAGIALLALIALVAGQRWGSAVARGGTSAQSATPAPGFGAIAPVPAAAPGISAMSPQERADRLFNRIMTLHEQGKTDSVQFFAPMAVSAYQMLGPLEPDQHYDLGRIGAVIGVRELARAQADSILNAQPNHLLGLALAADAARLAGDETSARRFEQRLIAAAPAELERNLPEYQRHRNDIDRALAQANR